MIRGHMRYFVQLIVKGVPPVKHVYAPKDLKVAVDPGPRTMTFYSPEWQQKILVSAGTVSQEKEIARLLRTMDRSRRDTNREYCSADGTVKAARKKIVWKESKTYKATKAKLADLYRRQAEVSTIPKRERTGRKLFGREAISWEIRAGTWTAMSRPP